MDQVMSETPQLGHRCSSGGGNAAIRPYQCHPHWQAAGVPTGSYTKGPHYMGYSLLDAQVTTAVRHAIEQIDKLLATGRFDTLAFSYDPVTKLGGRIFSTAQLVRDHIYDQLVAVAGRHGVTLLQSKFAGAGKDGDFSYMITRQPQTLFVFNDNEEEFYAHYNDAANPYR
jgi:hypothetical protein